MKPRLLLIVFLLVSTIVMAADPALRYVQSGDETVAAVVSEQSGVIYTNQVFTHSAEHALMLLDGSIEHAGGDPTRVVKLNVAVTTQEQADAARTAIRAHYPAASRPPASFVVGALAMPKRAIGVDAVALPTTQPTPRRRAARPVTYVSGQAEKGASAADATAKTIAALIKTLESVGAKPRDVVHARCYLTPIADAEQISAEFEKAFGKDHLTVAAVEWRSDLPIEIELIAAAPAAPAGAPAVEYLTPPGMKPSPLFARVVRVNRGDLIYTAGLYAEKAGTGEQQVLSIFDQLQRILKQSGGDLHHLAKATYYVSDDDASRQLNVLRPRFYDPQRPPAASKAMVSGVGMKDRSISIDLIGVVVPTATTTPTR